MNNTQLSASTKQTLAQTMPIGSREFKVASRPVVSYSGAQQNELLAALPREVLESLFEHLELVTLPFGKELFEYGSKLDNVYFPTTAIVSLLYVMEDGATTEIAVVGHEGVVGVSMFAGERAMCSAVVQSAGYGYRLKAHHLREAFNQGGALPQLLMRYNTALFAQMAQNAVGGRHSSNELKVTQEMISIMLGVRRESITAAAGKLQDDGLITYRRGNITVIDRAGLESYAGECYKVAKTEYDRLLVDVARC